MSLNGTYSVTCSGNVIGTLTVSDDGPRKLFRLDSEITTDISRLVCFYDGRPVSVGIPVPQSGRLSLCKSFTRTQQKQMGLSAISSAELLPISAPLRSAAAHPSAEDIPCPAESEIIISTERQHSEPPADIPSECTLSGGWEAEPDPGSFFRDDIAVAACKNVHGALSRPCGGGVSLAVPVSETEGFPLTAFLCFSTPTEINGEKYVVFTVKDGVVV